MTDDSDYIRDVLDAFSSLTNVLMPSAIDYALAQDWEARGVPLSIVVRGIQDKAQRAQGKPWLTNGRAKLEYFREDVEETFRNWRRAVGR